MVKYSGIVYFLKSLIRCFPHNLIVMCYVIFFDEVCDQGSTTDIIVAESFFFCPDAGLILFNTVLYVDAMVNRKMLLIIAIRCIFTMSSLVAQKKKRKCNYTIKQRRTNFTQKLNLCNSVIL